MSEVRCPTCGAYMRKDVALPSFLQPSRMAEKHPLPIVRRFAVQTAEKVESEIEENIVTLSCPECGHIQPYHRDRFQRWRKKIKQRSQ